MSNNPHRPKFGRIGIYSALLAVLAGNVGFGLVLPLLPSYASAFNADPWQITILLAGHAAGLFLGEMTWGQASDRFGRRPIILVTILMAGASQLMLAFSPNVWMAIAARLCGGFFSGNVSTIQSYMVDITPSERVPVRLGHVGTALSMGFVLGPSIGGLLARPDLGLPGLRLPPMLAAGLGMTAFLGVLFFLRESRLADGDKPRTQGLVDGFRVAFTSLAAQRFLASSLFTLMGFSILWAVFGLWSHAQFGWTAPTIGLLMALAGGASAASQGLFIGYSVRKFGEFGTIALGLGMVGISLFLLAIAPPEWTVPPLVIAASVGIALSLPPTSALISKATPEEHWGMALGANAAAGALGRVIGPLTGGFLFSVAGRNAPYLLAAALMLPAVYFARRGLRYL